MKDYIKDIESNPNFEEWIIFNYEGELLGEFDKYNKMLEVFDEMDGENCFAGYALADPRNIMNTSFKEAKIFY